MTRAIRPQIVAAIALFVSALGVFVVKAHGFDASLRDRDVAVAPAVWSDPAAGPWVAPLGAFELPTPGVLRVVACPARATDPHATLEVTDARGRSLGSERLTADESRGNRCFDASYHADRAGPVHARVRFARASAHPVLGSLETSASRRITPWALGPVLAMLASFVLVITAPRRPIDQGDAPAPDAPPPPPPPPADAPWGSLGGVIPAGMIPPGAGPPTVDPATGALVLPDVFHAPPPALLEPTKPLVDRPFSWLLALLAYVGVFIATGVVGAIYMIASGRRDVVESASFIVVTLLVQHGLLALVAAFFMGAFDGRTGMRAAVGLVPITRRQVFEAVGLGLALCGLAALSTRFIHDVSVSPMGRMIEHVPIRYAIGFGALLAPLTEELFFRGVLVRAFGKKSTVVGVVAGAIVFTLAHAMQLQGAWVGLIPICAVALINGWLRVRTGGITQPWLVHTVYNLTLSLGLYFS